MLVASAAYGVTLQCRFAKMSVSNAVWLTDECDFVECDVELSPDYSPVETKIGVNSKYLIDALDAHRRWSKGETVRMHITETCAPLYMLGDDCWTVVMPLRL
jgi:DNA polymerase III sliding clamp (beta) subunit (PCNA family)